MISTRNVKSAIKCRSYTHADSAIESPCLYCEDKVRTKSQRNLKFRVS